MILRSARICEDVERVLWKLVGTKYFFDLSAEVCSVGYIFLQRLDWGWFHDSFLVRSPLFGTETERPHSAGRLPLKVTLQNESSTSLQLGSFQILSGRPSRPGALSGIICLIVFSSSSILKSSVEIFSFRLKPVFVCDVIQKILKLIFLLFQEIASISETVRGFWLLIQYFVYPVLFFWDLGNLEILLSVC